MKKMFIKKSYKFFSLVLIFLIISFTSSIFLNLFTVHGKSMEPTVSEDSFIITLDLTGIFADKIERGELIIINLNSKKLLKRVIAIPGDTIWTKNGIMYINNLEYLEKVKISQSDKSLGDWHYDWLLDEVNLYNYKPTNMKWGPIYLPSNKYFILGDNLKNSKDSRDIGYIDRKEIMESVLIAF